MCEDIVEEAGFEIAFFRVLHPGIEVGFEQPARHVFGDFDAVAGDADERANVQRHHLGLPHDADLCRVLGQRRGKSIRAEFLGVEVIEEDGGASLDQCGGEALVEFSGIVAAGEGVRGCAAGDDADSLDKKSLAGAGTAECGGVAEKAGGGLQGRSARCGQQGDEEGAFIQTGGPCLDRQPRPQARGLASALASANGNVRKVCLMRMSAAAASRPVGFSGMLRAGMLWHHRPVAGSYPSMLWMVPSPLRMGVVAIPAKRFRPHRPSSPFR